MQCMKCRTIWDQGVEGEGYEQILCRYCFDKEYGAKP